MHLQNVQHVHAVVRFSFL